jgi:hypothetical protein
MFNARDLLYFAGSVPLPNSEDVFRALNSEVGKFLRRMPDGETGERTLWIKFQQRMLLELRQSNPIQHSRRFLSGKPMAGCIAMFSLCA